MSGLLAETPSGIPSASGGPPEAPNSAVTHKAAPNHRANQDDQPVDDLALENGEVGGDPLEYSQKERQQQFEGGLALSLGPVMPWSEYGASVFWRKADIIQNLSLGGGNFEFSDNYRDRNYIVKVDSQSAYYAARWFVLGFGPLYLEPFVGLVRWSGSIRPRGFDKLSDSLASSLNSRFDITGVSTGGNLGLMWIFSKGVYLDYNFLSLSGAAFVQRSFTTNTSEARNNVRRELGGPLTVSNLQLRVGWSMKL